MPTLGKWRRMDHLQLSIPKSQQSVIAAVAKLSDLAFDDLLSTISGVPATASIEQFGAMLAEAGTTIDSGELAMMVISLAALVDRGTAGVAAVARAVAEDAKSKSLIDEAGSLETRVLKLLNVRSGLLTAKAVRLASEAGASYCSSRVLSDIRPVFDGKEPPDPAACMLVHTLHVEVHGREDDYFVVLTPQDLRDLKAQIERAVEKEASLAALMSRSGLPVLTTGKHRRSRD